VSSLQVFPYINVQSHTFRSLNIKNDSKISRKTWKWW